MAKTPQEVFTQASEHITEFYESQNIIDWRTYEVRENYQLIDSNCATGGQWSRKDYDYFRKDDLQIIEINKASPVIDAIVGFEIQNRTETDYIPRVLDNEQQGFSDLVGKTARYIEHDSNSRFLDSQCFRDMAICGIGCSDFDIDYMDPPHDGNVKQERVFPGFVGWDVAACEKNLTDANHVFRAKVVRKEIADHMLKRAGESEDSYTGGSIARDKFIDFFNIYSSVQTDLEVIYMYQWREAQPFYKVKNPFIQFAERDPSMMGDLDVLMMNYVPIAEEMYGIRAQDGVFNMDPKQYRGFAKDMRAMGVDLDRAEFEKWRYYRAKIVGSHVLSVSDNWSQKGFSMKFMTGKYSETERMFYGVTRAQKEPQRMLNRNISRYEAFLDNVVLGNVDIEKTAVDDLPGFINTYKKSKRKGVTVYDDGAVAQNRVRPTPQPQFPQGLAEIIPFSTSSVQEVAGVTPDFMGMVDQGDQMSGLLYSRKVKQGLSVLSWMFDAKRYYMVEKGRLYIDATRILAENNPGRIIRDITGNESTPYFRLFEDGVAEEYDIIVDEMPQTPDERYEFAKQLLQLSAQIPQLAPLALDGLPFDKDEIEKAKQALLPPPPPAPDPVAQRLLAAESESKIALAEKSRAEAELKKAQTLTELQDLRNGKTPEAPPPEKPDPSHAINLAEKAAIHEREIRKLDMDEAKTAADLEERERKLMLDEQRLQLEEQRILIEKARAEAEGAKVKKPTITKKTKDPEPEEKILLQLADMMTQNQKANMQAMDKITQNMAKNSDRLAGSVDKAVGSVGEKVGKAVGNAVSSALGDKLDALARIGTIQAESAINIARNTQEEVNKKPQKRNYKVLRDPKTKELIGIEAS